MRRADLPWVCAIIFGLALGFPNNFVEAPFLALFWPVGCAVLGARAPSAFYAARLAWLAGFIGGAFALYWLYLPVHEVGGLAFAPAFACALAIALAATTQGGLLALCAYFIKNRGAPGALFLGLLWYLLEWGYAALFGFPWLSPAGALAVWPVLAQACALVGAYALDGLWVCALLMCVFARGRRGLPLLAGGLCLAACITAFGFWRLAEETPSGETVRALFVEGNVDQNQKWEPAFQRATLELYMDLTRKALERRPPGEVLAIWPETALPFFYQSRPELAAIVREFAREIDCPLLFGAPGLEWLPGAVEPAVFNRAFLLAPDGSLAGYYDKEHLVPFGEYLPSWLRWGFLEALLQGVGIYHAGSHTAPLKLGALDLGMLICYEGIFPWLAQARVAAGANILVDISNDGWFGASPAARQHLYLTAPRCIEQNRWLLRATNTGISAVVDARGRIRQAGPSYRRGAMYADGELLAGKTVYHHIAPWLPGLAFAFLLLLAPFLFKNKIKKP